MKAFVVHNDTPILDEYKESCNQDKVNCKVIFSESVVALFTGNQSKLNVKDKSSDKFMSPEADKERWDIARTLIKARAD